MSWFSSEKDTKLQTRIEDVEILVNTIKRRWLEMEEKYDKKIMSVAHDQDYVGRKWVCTEIYNIYHVLNQNSLFMGQKGSPEQIECINNSLLALDKLHKDILKESSVSKNILNEAEANLAKQFDERITSLEGIIKRSDDRKLKREHDKSLAKERDLHTREKVLKYAKDWFEKHYAFEVSVRTSNMINKFLTDMEREL